MQIHRSKNNSNTKRKFNDIEENLKIEKKEINLSKILSFTIHSSNYLYRRIDLKKNLYEDVILNQKISLHIEKKEKKYYLRENDFNKLKELYEKEKLIYENSISFKDFCKFISRTYAHIYSHIKGEILELPDKLNKIHKLPLIKIAGDLFIPSKDAEKYISIYSQYFSLADFSEELFNLNKRILWKKIKKDKEGKSFIEVKFKETKYRLNLIKNNSNMYYITRESYEGIKDFLKEKQESLSNYVLFKDFFKKKKIPFKNGYYKTIKNNEFRFIYKKKLHILQIETINSNFYLDKEEVEKFNTYFSKTTYFSLDSLNQLISQKLNFQLKKKLENLKCDDGEIELTYDDLNLRLNVKFFKSFYFSKKELEKTYYFMSKVNEKTNNLKHLYTYLNNVKNKSKKVHKRLNKEKLILRDNKNKIFVRLKKIDNEFFFNVEDKEKINKLFN